MKKILFTAIVLSISSFAFAADKTTQKAMPYPEMTADMKSKMADMHQQMANCLKTEKSFQDCRTDMGASCQEFGHMMPMMGAQGKGMAKQHRSMMGGYPGMMTGFCDETAPKSDSKKSKTKK